MAVVDLFGKFFCKTIQKKLNRDTTIYPDHPKQGAGCLTFLQSGIYQMRRYGKNRVCVREKFYKPSNQTQPNKVISQEKFAAAVLAWQNLTVERKMKYNKWAFDKHMSGYNLFIREYMHG